MRLRTPRPSCIFNSLACPRFGEPSVRRSARPMTAPHCKRMLFVPLAAMKDEHANEKAAAAAAAAFMTSERARSGIFNLPAAAAVLLCAALLLPFIERRTQRESARPPAPAPVHPSAFRRSIPTTLLVDATSSETRRFKGAFRGPRKEPLQTQRITMGTNRPTQK